MQRKVMVTPSSRADFTLKRILIVVPAPKASEASPSEGAPKKARGKLAAKIGKKPASKLASKKQKKEVVGQDIDDNPRSFASEGKPFKFNLELVLDFNSKPLFQIQDMFAHLAHCFLEKHEEALR